jgi:hypothetical protein
MVFWTESGSSPYSAVVGHFNHDDQLDLAIANSGVYYVGILLGNGDGTFREQMTFYNDPSVYMVTADFNSDGQLDLAAACLYNGTINVLFGNGDGTFSIPLILSTGLYSNPSALAVGDFNGDSQWDLAVANSETYNIGILLGNGNGTFGEQTTYSTGGYSNPNSVVVGDFNNDHQVDLAVANWYTHNVGILLGIGNGSFLQQMTFSPGTQSTPESVDVGDFNSDGKLDLVIVDLSHSNVYILLNTCDCCVP